MNLTKVTDDVKPHLTSPHSYFGVAKRDGHSARQSNWQQKSQRERSSLDDAFAAAAQKDASSQQAYAENPPKQTQGE